MEASEVLFFCLHHIITIPRVLYGNLVYENNRMHSKYLKNYLPFSEYLVMLVTR